MAVVRCRRPFDFDDTAYRRYDDQFRNCVFLPPSLFEELGIEPFEYVRVREHGGGDDRVVMQTALFEPESVDAPGDHPLAALRTNLTEKIREGLDRNTLLEVTAIQHPYREMQVGRGYDDNRGAGICYVADDAKRAVGVDEDEPVELYDPVDGGRSILETAPLPGDAPNESVVRVDGHIQETLAIEFGDSIRMRSPVAGGTVEPSVGERVFGAFVGYRDVHLRVELGLDRDEYRNVVRMQEDTMRFLGIEPGDRVVIRWGGEQLAAQCLLPPEDTSVPDAAILLASTDRDPIDVSLYDTVVVRRDMGHILKQRIAVSLLGILGVVFGVFQAATVATLDELLVARFGPFGAVLALGAVSGLLSVLVVWLLLFPERQRCAQPSTAVR
jgi:hypothetical protein